MLSGVPLTLKVWRFGREMHKVEYQYLRCSIVPNDNKVISVGGATSKDSTAAQSNQLLSYNMSTNKWEQKLPCIPTKRSRATTLIIDPILELGGLLL